jgi:hypothetical protein
MKKMTLIMFISFIALSNTYAQQEKGITGYENWLKPWTEFRPNKVDHPSPTQILSGNISQDTKLYKKEIYLMLGDVFVVNDATLTIEPGTVIIGDFKSKASLTISKGAKIVARGTSTDPIVFTSSQNMKKPGDWGGIFILGDATTNKIEGETTLNFGLVPTSAKHINYGGNNPESNSGVLSYVRIEYAGKRTKKYGHFNGITLAGVGHKTLINNIMVSYCLGNSFNVLGGVLSLDKLVSYRSSMNDYEFNFGAQCSITNSLAIKSPYVSGAVASKAVNALDFNLKEEVDFSKDHTSVIAENLTIINVSNDLDYDIKVGLVNEGIYVGQNTSFAINKSVISGFSPAVILDNKIKLNEGSLQKIKFASTYFNNCNGNIFKKGISNNDDLENWYGSRAFNNVYSKGPDSETFIDPGNSRSPDFRLRINKIIATTD